MQKSRIREKIKKLPKSPGVYIFYGFKKEILYVGKATNLKYRVRSYFSTPERFNLSRLKQPKEVEPLTYSRPVETAINQIMDIKTIQTDTVLEAFILEQNLIKKLQPKYNAMGKDDKSFCYVVLTKEQFPSFIIMRERELGKIQKINFTPFGKGGLRGDLKNSDKQKIPLSFRQLPLKKGEFIEKYAKVFGPYTSRKNIEIVLKLLKRIFPYHSSAQKTEKGCLDFELGRCPGPYAGAITRTDYLKNIRGIRMILEGKKKGLMKKLEKEMKSYSDNHEFEKAADVRNKLFALKHINDIALISKESPHPALRATLSPKGARGNMEKTMRIEAYDISNISGQYAVGSMVVFQNSESDKSQYRKFRIKTIKDSDDVGMMREVLVRRFNNNWPKPNLILLDGGSGHLHMAEKLLKELDFNILLAAVAKGPDRNKLDLRFSNKDLRIEIDELLKNRNLIKKIMDEAHRFAITYHRKVRKREFIK